MNQSHEGRSISVLIVTYNSEETIERSLRELQGCTLIREVIIVDNASTDASVAVIRRAAKQSRLICNEQNIGFASAVNQIASRATGKYLLILNPDCFVSPLTLGHLAGLVETHRNISIVAPRIVSEDGKSSRTLGAGWEPSIQTVMNHSTGLASFSKSHRHLRGLYLTCSRYAENDNYVDWVGGACMLVRREAWIEVGGLSERWFMYSEDIDLCRRVREMGGQVMHAGSVVALHVGGASHVAGTVSTLWVRSLIDYYSSKPGRRAVSIVTFSWLLAAGMEARAFVSILLWIGRRDRNQLVRARAFGKFGRIALVGPLSKSDVYHRVRPTS